MGESMGRSIYVSFLGTGRYLDAEYVWEEARASATPYAQEAELELLKETPDRVLIFGTSSSRTKHWERYDGEERPGLKSRLEKLNLRPEFVEISEDLSTEAQWGTFEKMLGFFEPGDRLIWDVTHGFRAVPVVFSSALHFLRLTRGVEIVHVLYAAHDTRPARIVDYVDFYAIQDWTDGVSRLVEDADAARLVALSKGGSRLQLEGFSGQELAEALSALTDTVRHVDLQRVEVKARRALELVERARIRAEQRGQVASRVLLQQICEKFAGLTTVEPHSGHYDGDYFEVQLKLIELLLEHNLLMQAFTAMRELVASIGMLGTRPVIANDKDGRERRRSADIFFVMLKITPDKWYFSSKDEGLVDCLRPFYERLAAAGVVEELRAFIEPLSDIRNGFDHGWTGRRKEFIDSSADELRVQGKQYLAQLKAVVRRVLALKAADQVSQ